MRHLKCIFEYILVLLPSLGLLLNTLQNKKFSVDEFQHTHLAWMAIHFDKFQYKEIWDNHGPLYTIVNSILIKTLELGANTGTYLAERYLNLIILITGFLILFELFRSLTGKWYYAALGPWLFATSLFSIHAIEIRPDNLQCLFLYLALLLLVKSFEQNKQILAFYSGISLALMLMTQLKSLSALAAISASLVLLHLLDKESKAINQALSMYKGLGLSLFIAMALLTANGMIEGYIHDNIAFNFATIQTVQEAAVQKAKQYYLVNHHLLNILILVSSFSWAYQIFKAQKIQAGKFIVFVTVMLLGLTKLKVHLWTQYDLLFIPLFCYIASSFIFQSLEPLTQKIAKSQVTKSLCIAVMFVSFSYLGWKEILKNPKPLTKYYKYTNHRIKAVANHLKKTHKIENCGRNVPELGFFETGSRRILQLPIIMKAHQKLSTKPLQSQEYIDLFENENVHILLGNKKIFQYCGGSTELQNFIKENYSLHKNYWRRKE